MLRAVEANDVVQAKSVIGEALATEQCDETILSTALTRACERDLIDVARFLLLAGANANHVSGSRMPNLRRAAELGLLDIARLLIDHNADVEARDKKGRTALMTAAWKVSAECYLLLASGLARCSSKHTSRFVVFSIDTD